jgi:hypothetical protein
MYEVVSYIGDHPLKNQPNWGKGFGDLSSAIAAARAQHSSLTDQDAYTVVQNAPDGAVYFVIFRDQERSGAAAQKLADDLARRG